MFKKINFNLIMDNTRGRKKKKNIILNERPILENKLKLTEYNTTYCNSSIDFGGIKVFIKSAENEKGGVNLEEKNPIYKFPKIRKKEDLEFTIPDEFKDLPEKTDICCWWCTEKFTNRPLSLPISHTHNNYIFHGVFCSWPCVKSFSYNINDSKIGIRNDYINSLVRKMYGKFIHIDKAPFRYKLKKFGGELDIDEFRSFIQNNNTNDLHIKVTPITLGALKFT